MGRMSNFLTAGYDSPPSPGFPIMVQGKVMEGRQCKTGACNKTTLKEETFLVRMEIPGV